MRKNTSKPKILSGRKGEPLAVISIFDEVILLEKKSVSSNELFLSWSKNGVDFIPDKKKVTIKKINKKSEDIKYCHNFSISKTPSGFTMVYFRRGVKKTKPKLVVARSKDLYKWEVKSEISSGDSEHATVVYDKSKDKFEMYRDGLFIRNQASFSLSVWKEKPSLLLRPESVSLMLGK